MRSVVLGGLTYTEFAKYAELEVRSEEKEDYALLKLCARDPYGKRVDDGQEYFPRGDLFYLDLYTEDPFHSLEVYGKRLALAQKAEPNLHSFPSVCLWYAEFYDMMNVSGEKLNTSGGAVREMESIRNSGFLNMFLLQSGWFRTITARITMEEIPSRAGGTTSTGADIRTKRKETDGIQRHMRQPQSGRER